jgi:hypothetical protein
MKRKKYVLRQQSHATYLSRENKFGKHYTFLGFVWLKVADAK